MPVCTASRSDSEADSDSVPEMTETQREKTMHGRPVSRFDSFISAKKKRVSYVP